MSFINHSQYQRVAPARIDQRSEERHRVILQKASVRGEVTEQEEAQLVDVSSFGCRLVVEGQYPEGSELSLVFFDREPMAAKAVWFKDGQLGCRFADAIDLCLFRALTIQSA